MNSLLEQIQAQTTNSIETSAFTQVLRGNPKTQAGCGFFVTDEQAERVGFKPAANSGWARHKNLFNGADDFTHGWLNANPRFVVVKSSALAMFRKSDNKFVCLYNGSLYNGFDGKALSYFEDEANKDKPKTNSNKSLFDLKTKYKIFYVGAENQLLHDVPLQLTLKGVMGGSFGQELGNFKKAFCALIKKTERNDSDFWASCIIQPQVKSEEKRFANGTGTAARIVGFTPIDVDNLEQFYLFNPEVVAQVMQTRQALAEYGWAVEQKQPDTVEMQGEEEPEGKAPKTSPAGTALIAQIRASMEEGEVETTDIPF